MANTRKVYSVLLDQESYDELLNSVLTTLLACEKLTHMPASKRCAEVYRRIKLCLECADCESLEIPYP